MSTRLKSIIVQYQLILFSVLRGPAHDNVCACLIPCLGTFQKWIKEMKPVLSTVLKLDCYFGRRIVSDSLKKGFVCLFVCLNDLILHVPSTIFQ